MEINSKSEEIFKNLKKYITQTSKYSPSVLKSVVDNKYPLVVFETNSNISSYITQDMFRLNQVRSLSFEISIFSTDQKGIAGEVICEELANLVCEVMQEYYGMQGGIDAKLKNINPAKATKYVLHFVCKWNVKTNNIY